MSSTPLISVLMPAYNAEKFIAKAINSILNQDYLNWELLILNDASTDKTAEVIDGFTDQRIKVFRHLENRGYLLCCNELFEKAEGGFITFLDADDHCPTNRLSACLQQFESYPQLGFITTDHQRISESGAVSSIHSIAIDYQRYGNEPDYNPTICCATIFLRRSLLLKVGGYREFFKNIGGEDYFWLWELSKNGMGKHLNVSLYNYLQHPGQTSKNHTNELSLFLPELITLLKTEITNAQWNEASAARALKTVTESFIKSPFEVSLRKAQVNLNHSRNPFFSSALQVFFAISTPKQLKQFCYLLYSYLHRKLRTR
ncbi:MAG: glycosyltransferase [Flavobacteriales bacterium]|nr:glycosyltransferase [Flavobacteriales bacterium]